MDEAVCERRKAFLPLIEAMKIVRLTYLLPDMPHLSLPQPRLRHGRRLAHLFLLHLTVAGSSSSSSSPNFLNCYSSRESASVFADYLRSHFSVFQSKALSSRVRRYLSKVRRATCPDESHSSFCFPSSLLNFLQLPQISPRPLPLAQTKLPIPF